MGLYVDVGLSDLRRTQMAVMATNARAKYSTLETCQLFDRLARDGRSRILEFIISFEIFSLLLE